MLIRFTKLFTEGPLVGIEYNESLMGCTEEHVETFKRRERDRVVIHPAVGGSPYRIANVQVEPANG